MDPVFNKGMNGSMSKSPSNGLFSVYSGFRNARTVDARCLLHLTVVSIIRLSTEAPGCPFL